LPEIEPMLNIEYLAELAQKHGRALSVPVRSFPLAGKEFDFDKRPAIMGVVNLSPDSWYRESVCLSRDRAVDRCRVLAAQGADILDLGAESTLAHAARRDAASQNSVLAPLIEDLSSEGFRVSVETYCVEVARASLDAGAAVLNLTGTGDSEEMFRLAADFDAAVILCYVQGENVREVGDFDLSQDPIPPMHDFFSRQIELAERAGAKKLFIDPGMGFYYRNLQDSAVRVRHQMQTFLNSFRLRDLGVPICQALPHAFEFFGEEVRCAEPFFAVLAALGKTGLFRTHEVPRIKAVLETLQCFEP
jgi:dihydropteroate synthase